MILFLKSKKIPVKKTVYCSIIQKNRFYKSDTKQ